MEPASASFVSLYYAFIHPKSITVRPKERRYKAIFFSIFVEIQFCQKTYSPIRF